MSKLLKILNNSPFSVKSITTRTPVKLNKSTRDDQNNRIDNPHFGNITKVVEDMKVLIGADYQEMVNERLTSEGKDATFVSNPRKWGERIGNSCLITHKGNLYAEVIVEEPGNVVYEYRGEEIAKQDIIGMQNSNKPSKESQGGLRDKLIIRTIKLDNIIDFVLG